MVAEMYISVVRPEATVSTVIGQLRRFCSSRRVMPMRVTMPR